MKKIFLLFVLAPFYHLAIAQVDSYDIWFKIVNGKYAKTNEHDVAYAYIGGGFSNVTGGGNNVAASGQAGIGVNVYANKSFTVRAALAGSLQGAKHKSTTYNYDTGYNYTPSGSSTQTLRLFYLGLPIVARYKTHSGFFAEAGLQPAFLLSAKYKSEGTSTDYKDHIKTFDLGVPIGFGYQFHNRIAVGAMVIPGVTNINKTSSSYSYGSKDASHNLQALLRVSYGF